jgi:hypothetical protein
MPGIQKSMHVNQYDHLGKLSETIWRMLSPGMLHHVVLVSTDVSEELSAPIIRVTRIGEPGMLAVTSNRSTLQRNETLLRSILQCKPSWIVSS